MIEQLIKKDCTSGEYENIYPITLLDNVIRADGTKLRDILHATNHLFLQFKNNNRRDTRLQVASDERRVGLWITYITCTGGPITEWYKGESLEDSDWGDSRNWVPYIDDEVIDMLLRKKLSWYKA